jgi:hypothetical protein
MVFQFLLLHKKSVDPLIILEFCPIEVKIFIVILTPLCFAIREVHYGVNRKIVESKVIKNFMQLIICEHRI